MTIKALRILPPFAIGRLGSASEPLDNYSIEVDEDRPLDFRRIVPQETLVVDPRTGEISAKRTAESITFKTDGRIHPVAPFLEVFARVDNERAWRPLTVPLLAAHGLKPSDLRWNVTVANRKVERRTGNAHDRVEARTGWFRGHAPKRLEGHCENFVSKSKGIDFGSVRYIKPTKEFPEIRFRFTPATGLIYGPVLSPAQAKKLKKEFPDIYEVPKARQVYDTRKPGAKWFRFEVPSGIDNPAPGFDGPFVNETLPPSLFAIIPPAPSWLNDNVAVSRGYFDDACDGVVEVALVPAPGAERLTAVARITAGPPAIVPDALFVRSLGDDLDQVIFGPAIDGAEDAAETRARAKDIVRRAFETVRFLNVAVMNGNPVEARDPLDIDTMPAEEAFDVLRPMRPVFGPNTVDTRTIMRLHQQVYAALRGGAAPWFPPLLRLPEQVADFTDSGRRKMPALMCGADGSYLALTHRQINTIYKAAGLHRDMQYEKKKLPADVKRPVPALAPRNASARRHRNDPGRRHEEVNYVAAGNPVSSRPETSVGNCTPGLEVDFRAVWRRLFEGIVIREYDNLVVEVEHDSLKHLLGCRLMRVRFGEGNKHYFYTMTTQVGPSPADTVNQSVVYATDANPLGLAPLEWSNALARMLHECVGGVVVGDFSSKPSWFAQLPWSDAKESYVSHELRVRHFFEDDTAVISRELAQPGELTQGLCSPWQNDYRECSCYYWASARPDFVNMEPSSDALSAGDNWLQKRRTGEYVPDDYVDARMVLYDDLFHDWEQWVRFAVRGRDAEGEFAG
ncbi:MAG: hypothetical protein K8S21_12255 [Gemmatimonadetes bacterium]|nr:hypothetical protein [Gemmatimonadota bacterium]